MHPARHLIQTATENPGGHPAAAGDATNCFCSGRFPGPAQKLRLPPAWQRGRTMRTKAVTDGVCRILYSFGFQGYGWNKKILTARGAQRFLNLAAQYSQIEGLLQERRFQEFAVTQQRLF